MTTMIDTLSIMFPSENFVKTDVKTDLGFIIGKFEFLSFNIFFCYGVSKLELNIS